MKLPESFRGFLEDTKTPAILLKELCEIAGVIMILVAGCGVFKVQLGIQSVRELEDETRALVEVVYARARTNGKLDEKESAVRECVQREERCNDLRVSTTQDTTAFGERIFRSLFTETDERIECARRLRDCVDDER
ncbi:MAG: hypothetical protein UY05_C0006G0015 [Candidatus Peregrinibacteria bacterium GW2011_GWA2_47_7]|nr:MAG: hypothetical protein UY05_C0006G0015 [Candidatus Peregrinibacteria bacterium GW2011_GWA2_47_7]